MSFWNYSRTIVAMAAAAILGCAHEPASNTESTVRIAPQTGQAHLAAGCLAVCQEATYVELSPKGDLCRCWAPNAFQYTFPFPDTKDKLDYSRTRWSIGMQNVRRCQAQGKAWEPSQDREQIVCLDPSAPQSVPDRSAEDHSAKKDRSAEDHSAKKLPESVF